MDEFELVDYEDDPIFIGVVLCGESVKKLLPGLTAINSDTPDYGAWPLTFFTLEAGDDFPTAINTEESTSISESSTYLDFLFTITEQGESALFAQPLQALAKHYVVRENAIVNMIFPVQGSSANPYNTDLTYMLPVSVKADSAATSIFRVCNAILSPAYDSGLICIDTADVMNVLSTGNRITYERIAFNESAESTMKSLSQSLDGNARGVLMVVYGFDHLTVDLINSTQVVTDEQIEENSVVVIALTIDPNEPEPYVIDLIQVFDENA